MLLETKRRSIFCGRSSVIFPGMCFLLTLGLLCSTEVLVIQITWCTFTNPWFYGYQSLKQGFWRLKVQFVLLHSLVYSELKDQTEHFTLELWNWNVLQIQYKNIWVYECRYKNLHLYVPGICWGLENWDCKSSGTFHYLKSPSVSKHYRKYYNLCPLSLSVALLSFEFLLRWRMHSCCR